MVSESIRSHLLCDELQCPGQLNQLVTAGDRAQFHLLLNFFSQNVVDQPQFDFKTQEAKERAISAADRMREQFDLPPLAPIAMPENAPSYALSLAALVEEPTLTALHLRLSLQPEALARFNNPRRIDPEVLSQLDPIVREKFEQQRPAPEPESEAISMYQVLSNFNYDRELTVTHYQ